MKDSINVLFVCGYGVGSSAMSAGIVSRSLDKRHIKNVVEHTSAGEVSGFENWLDIIAVSKKFTDIVNTDSFPGKNIVEVENIMDGETIADQIMVIVKEQYPSVIGG